MGNGQMGTYVSHYNVVTCVQQRLCGVNSKAARLVLENNDTKINLVSINDNLLFQIWKALHCFHDKQKREEKN